MAIDAYLSFQNGSFKINNKTVPIAPKGESLDDVDPSLDDNAFEIISMNWSVSSNGKFDTSFKKPPKDAPESEKRMYEAWLKTQKGERQESTQGTEQRSPKVGAVTVKKPLDRASAFLFQACCAPQGSFETAKIVFRKAGPYGIPLIYLTFDFTVVRLDSFNWTIAPIESSSDKPDQEELVFSFETCQLTYNVQDATGTGGKKLIVKWDNNAESATVSSG